MTWHPISRGYPKPGRPVLAWVLTPRPCVLLAQWAPAKTLPLHDEAEGGDYDEERDEYFAEEGWYQCYAVSGSLDDEPFWKIHEEVTHWMPLPPPPGAQDDGSGPSVDTRKSFGPVERSVAMGEAWRSDREYEDRTLEKVVRSGKGYELHQESGWVLHIDDPGWEPTAGDTARFFGEGIGRPIRGVVVFPKRGGMPLVAYYRTAEEEQERHDKWVGEQRAERRATADAERVVNEARIAALPEVFRRRIARFRAANDDFEVEYQPYELFCCEEAVKIAEALRSRPDDVRAFAKLTWDQQKQLVPSLSGDHSGNTFGTAVRLAHWYLSQPENVVREHGALTPLVGCQAYGCTHETVTGDGAQE